MKILNRIKLSTKLIIANSFLILLVSGVLTLGLYLEIRNAQRQVIHERLQDILNFSGPLVDGDFHSLIQSPEDEAGSFYKVVALRLKSIQDTSDTIERIYTLRQLSDGTLTYVVDVDRTGHATVGQEYTRASPLLDNGLASISSPTAEENIYTDTYGTFLSGYVPVYDQFRNLDGVLGIDITADSIIATEKRARNIALLSFLATVPFSLFLGAWFARKITAPVRELMEGARRVANGQFSERVPVHNQDELGILANTFNHMTSQLQQTMQGLEQEIIKQTQAQKLQDITYQISQAAVSTKSIDDLYQTIQGHLGKLISVDNFYIALFDSTTNLLSFPYYVDQYDEPPPPAKPGRGLTEYVLRNGQPLLATKEIHNNLIQSGLVDMVGTPSYEWLGVPLKVDDQTIGVMGTQGYSEEIHFTEENVDLFEFVSSQIAQTIERKRAEEDLNLSNERYYRLFEESPISLWEEDLSDVKQILDSYKQAGVTDFNTFLAAHPDVVAECAANVKIVDVNKASLVLLGAASKKELTKSLQDTFHDDSLAYFKDELVNLADGQTEFTKDGVKLTLDGKRIDVSMKWSVLSGSEHDLSKVIISMIDITERKKSENKLTYISTHDALTDLYNRAFFNEEITRFKKEELFPVSIIMTDLDDLKKTNDRYGHSTGDKLLVHVAGALKAGFRTGDVVARIGGDEFAILLPNTNEETARKAIQRFKDIVKEINSINPDVPLHLSIGVSTVKQGGSIEKAFIDADQKMYINKQNKNENK